MSLVPSNHRLKEHALAAVLEQLRLDPGAMETLWDAWRCPAAFLPYLAWSLSVDLWDDGWDEVRKRRAIAESPEYHRRKGTAQAVADAAAYTGRETTMLEWHHFVPERRRGTFVVQAHLSDNEAVMPVAEAKLLKRLVRAAKPKSRAFALIEAHVQSCAVVLGIATSSSDSIVLGVTPDDLTIEFTPRVWMDVAGAISVGVQ